MQIEQLVSILQRYPSDTQVLIGEGGSCHYELKIFETKESRGGRKLLRIESGDVVTRLPGVGVIVSDGRSNGSE